MLSSNVSNSVLALSSLQSCYDSMYLNVYSKFLPIEIRNHSRGVISVLQGKQGLFIRESENTSMCECEPSHTEDTFLQWARVVFEESAWMKAREGTAKRARLKKQTRLLPYVTVQAVGWEVVL